jgi:hypothetical protein
MFLSIIPMAIYAEEPTEEIEFILGDVNGDGVITIRDVLEIHYYLNEIDVNPNYTAIADGGQGSRAWNAALITGGDEPTGKDVLELLYYIVGVPNALSGNLDLIFTSNLTAKIEMFSDLKHSYGIVDYYTTVDIELSSRVLFETLDIDNASRPVGNISIGALYRVIDSTQLEVIITDNNNTVIPAGTLLFSQYFHGSVNELDITGDSISSVSISTRTLGQVRGEGKVSINDALEVLKHLAGIDSVIDNCEIALMASLIVSEGKPTIADVLEILKHLAGIPNKIG